MRGLGARVSEGILCVTFVGLGLSSSLPGMLQCSQQGMLVDEHPEGMVLLHS